MKKEPEEATKDEGPGERTWGRHKRSPAYVSYHSLLDLVDVGEDVGVAVVEYLKRHGAVMILKWRLIVVANSQFRLGVDLISVFNQHILVEIRSRARHVCSNDGCCRESGSASAAGDRDAESAGEIFERIVRSKIT